MLIENVDALKIWLVKAMTPICDADPQTLSKYVVALVKKEKPLKELKEVCQKELEVFLINKTSQFVDTLFAVLQSKSYLPVGSSNLKVLTPGTVTGDNKVDLKTIPVPLLSNGKIKAEPGQILVDKLAGSSRRDHRTVSGDVEHSSKAEVKELHTGVREKRPRSVSRDRRIVAARRDVRNDSDRKENRNRSGSRSRGKNIYDGKGKDIRSPSRDDQRLDSRERRVNSGKTSNTDKSTRRQRSGSRDRRRNNSGGRDHKKRGRSSGRAFGSRSHHRSSVTEKDLRNRLKSSRSASRDRARRTPVHNRLGRRGAGVSPGRPRVSDRDQRDEDSRRTVRSPLKQAQTRSRSRLRSLSKARSRSKLRSRSRHHSPPPSIRRVHSRSRSADRVTTMKAVVKREVSTRSRTRTPPRPRSVHRRTSKSPPSAVIKPYRETAIPTDRLVAADALSRSPSSDGAVDERDYRITVPLDMMNHHDEPDDHLLLLTSLPSPIRTSPHQPVTSRLHMHRPLPSRPRCRDYDEKGFCLRGDLCTFDHGSDPVIVDDMAFRGSGPPPPQSQRLPTQSLVSGGASADLLVDSPHIPLISAHRLAALNAAGSAPPAHPVNIHRIPPMQMHAPPPSGYFSPPRQIHSQFMIREGVEQMRDWSNERSTLHHAQPAAVYEQHGGYTLQQPSNVSIRQSAYLQDTIHALQPDDERRVIEMHRREANAGLVSAAVAQANRQNFDKSRLGARTVVMPPTPGDACTALEITCVPPALNKIEHINQHFSKFGKIVNLQVCHGGAPDRALVTYSAVEEAEAAYQSSEPVLSNRFIMVLKHQGENKQQQKQSDVQQQQLYMPTARRLTAKERLGTLPSVTQPAHATQLSVNQATPSSPQPAQQIPHRQKDLVLASPTGNIIKVIYNTLLPANPRLSRKKVNKPSVPVNKAVQNQMEISKMKHVLMQRQIEQQKALLAKLQSPSISSMEKESILKLIKQLDQSLELLKSDLCKFVSSSKAVKTKTPSTITQVHKPDALNVVQPKLETKMEIVDSKLKVEPRPQPVDTKPLVSSLVTVRRASNRLEMQKSILDAELELIARQNDGADTALLDREVSLLKMQASSMGIFNRGRGRSSFHRGGLSRGGYSMGRGRGFGSMIGRGRGRGGGGRIYKLSTERLIDRRSKQLLVTGFTTDESAELLQHLGKFGRIESSTADTTGNNTSGLVVSFVSRRDAEKVALEGMQFKEKRLSMSWYPPVSSSSSNLSIASVTSGSLDMTTVKPSSLDTNGKKEPNNTLPPNKETSTPIVEDKTGDVPSVAMDLPGAGDEESSSDYDDSDELIVGDDSIMLQDGEEYDEDALLKVQ